MFRFTFIGFVGGLACAVAQGTAPSTALGIFENQNDVGKVLHPGSAEYEAASDRYVVSGSGGNMWAASDEFHFVWKQISAQNVSLTADVSLLGNSAEGHRKGVLMIRQSLDEDSAYVDAALHGEGLASLQFREHKGATTREIESNVSGPSRLRVEKQGDQFYFWVGSENEPLEFSGGSARVPIEAPFYVGIGVCAHQKDAVERAAFTNVDLSESVAHTHAAYSTVETVLLSGDARSGFVSTHRLSAPGWSSDGHALTFEIDGHRQESPFTPLKTAAPVGTPVTSQPAEKVTYQANNQNGTMQIWRKGRDGDQPEQMTSDDSNNVSPRLSPDGKFVLFLSYSKDLSALPDKQDVALRVLSVADKSVKTLATFIGGQGSLGTEPWSPDGRRVAFISYQQMK